MKPAIKALWLDALRSGEYQQTDGELRNKNGFCCLGVLCDLHAKAGLGAWDGERYLGVPDILPEAVAAWARVMSVPVIGDASITDLNDGVNGFEARTFAEIADLIEEHL